MVILIFLVLKVVASNTFGPSILAMPTTSGIFLDWDTVGTLGFPLVGPFGVVARSSDSIRVLI